MVKGSQKTVNEGGFPKYVGFANIYPRAVNPTISERNKLFGKEDNEKDEEVNYVDEDKEGNKRVNLTFYLYDEEADINIKHVIKLVDKPAMSKDGVKTLFVNSACDSLYWPEDEELPQNFTDFMNKEKTESLGTKKVKKSIYGEAELLVFIRAWMGRLNFFDPTCEVVIDTARLLKGDVTELKSLISGDYDTPFVVLAGVETDSVDPSKQYQKIFTKAFLPSGFMQYIKKGCKFPSDYTQRIWDYFEKQATGEYGFQAHYDFCPIKKYDPSQDVAVADSAKNVTKTNSKY